MAKRGRKSIDHTGQRFYRLLVLAPAEQQKPGSATMWLCKCDCDRIVTVRGSNLRSGNSKSCGECGRVYVKRQPTEEQECERAFTYGGIYRRIIALRDKADAIKAAAYPNLGDAKITDALSRLKAFCEIAYRDLLWEELARSARNLDRADAVIRELEILMDGDEQQHERTPEHAMVFVK